MEPKNKNRGAKAGEGDPRISGSPRWVGEAAGDSKGLRAAGEPAGPRPDLALPDLQFWPVFHSSKGSGRVAGVGSQTWGQGNLTAVPVIVSHEPPNVSVNLLHLPP